MGTPSTGYGGRPPVRIITGLSPRGGPSLPRPPPHPASSHNLILNFKHTPTKMSTWPTRTVAVPPTSNLDNNVHTNSKMGVLTAPYTTNGGQRVSILGSTITEDVKTLINVKRILPCLGEGDLMCSPKSSKHLRSCAILCVLRSNKLIRRDSNGAVCYNYVKKMISRNLKQQPPKRGKIIYNNITILETKASIKESILNVLFYYYENTLIAMETKSDRTLKYKTHQKRNNLIINMNIGSDTRLVTSVRRGLDCGGTIEFTKNDCTQKSSVPPTMLGGRTGNWFGTTHLTTTPINLTEIERTLSARRSSAASYAVFYPNKPP